MKKNISKDYFAEINKFLSDYNIKKIEILIDTIIEIVKNEKQIFICGNGGSAANSIHIANDLCHLRTSNIKKGIKAKSLNENIALLTCYANDLSYDKIYSEQLRNFSSSNDLLIILSGSGNSKNLIKAIEFCKTNSVKTFAILGRNGGQCVNLVDDYLLTNTDSMQVSEDIQTIIFHIISLSLKSS